MKYLLNPRRTQLVIALCSVILFFSCKKDTDNAGPETGNSYYPMTAGSNWTYKVEGGAPADTFFQKVTSATMNAGGKTYTTVTLQDPRFGDTIKMYLRKEGQDVFQYITVEEQYVLDAPGTPANIEVVVLKENASVGDSWSNPVFTGIVSGVAATHTAKTTVIAKGPATSGVVTSNDVMKVLTEFYRNGVLWYAEENWYAKGIGLIYVSQKEGNATLFTANITRYKVL